MRRLFLFIAIALGATLPDLRAAGDWTVLENCRLIDNPANDGDSFHVSAGETEYVFRLYLVDTPEIESITPHRLTEQAKYFGITVPQVIEVGVVAKSFVQEKLSVPFKIFTHKSAAMGNSKIQRMSAFVQTNEGDLGEQLVRNGLARVHGIRGAPPGAKTGKVEVEKLQEFEAEARQEKIGGWGINDGRLHTHPAASTTYDFFAVEKNGTPAVALKTAKLTAAPSNEAASSNTTISPGQLDVNTATEKELEALPGVGPVMAARIIDARPYESANDLRKVSGIGDKKYQRIRRYFR